MYIGPWQEYRLSRYNSDAREVKDAASDNLRRELQKALEKSLDPELAAQAINALQPVLNKEPKRDTLPQITIPKRHHNHYNHRRHRPSQAHHLPSLRRAGISPAPPSHRSTMSEPVQGTRLLFTPDVEPPRLHTATKNSTSEAPLRQSNYNPSHVANILKLERSAKRANDFSQFWNWKDDAPKKPARSQVESKVDQLKRLHDAYREAVSKETEPDTPRNRIQLSPIQAPSSPIVSDRNVTEGDVVSKYFAPPPHDVTGIAAAMHHSPKKLSPRLNNHVSHSPKPSPRHKLGSASLSPKIDDSPRIDASSADDDVLNISDDGLIKWSATLNMNDIDSLY